MLKNNNTNMRSLVVVIVATVIMISVMIIIYVVSDINRFKKVDSSWSEFDDDVIKIGLYINSIRSNLGYGGVAHNFKEYVIRHDAKLVPVIEEGIELSLQSISDYQALDISAEEHDALNVIRGVIKSYSKNVSVAKNFIENNASVEEINAGVRVNDRPAIEAINMLVERSIERHGIKVSEASYIINSSKEFVYYIYLIIPVIIGLGLMVVRYFDRLIETNLNLICIKNELNDLLENSPDATLVVNESGLIERANSRATDIFGYGFKEITSLKIEDLLPDKYKKSHVVLRENYIKNASNKQLEPGRMLEARSKNGSIIPVDISLIRRKLDKKNMVIVTIRDMSSYHDFEEDLKKERDFSNSIIETAKAIILVLDTKGCIVDFNPYMEKVFGYSLSEVKGKDYFSIFVPEYDRNSIKKIFDQAVNDASTEGVVNPLITKNGGARFIEWHDRTLKNKEGNVTGLLAIGQDVTDRLKNEEIIRLQSTITEHMAEGVNIVRADDGVILYANPKFEMIFGYKNGELLNKHVSVLYCDLAGDANKVVENILSDLNSKGLWRGEVKNVKKDGSIFWSEATVTRFNHSEYGEVFISVQSDITRRKLSELERIKNEATIRTLIDAPTNEYFLLFDSNDNILELNAAAAKQLNGSVDNLRGKNIRDLFESDVVERRIGWGDIVKNNKAPMNFQDERNGQVFDINIYPVLDEHNNVIRNAVLGRDITDIKNESERRILHEIQHRNTLVREVNHRIKNNLQSVSGLLRRQGRIHPEIGEVINEAIAQVDAIAVVYGLQENENIQMDLESLLTNIAMSNSSLYESHGNINIDNRLDMKVIVHSDEAVPFALVLNELITNAIKYTNQISEAHIEITVEQQGDDVSISISNPGHLPAGFDIGKGQGLGTGLTLVKSLLPSDRYDFSLHTEGANVIALLKFNFKQLTNIH